MHTVRSSDVKFFRKQGKLRCSLERKLQRFEKYKFLACNVRNTVVGASQTCITLISITVVDVYISHISKLHNKVLSVLRGVFVTEQASHVLTEVSYSTPYAMK